MIKHVILQGKSLQIKINFEDLNLSVAFHRFSKDYTFSILLRLKTLKHFAYCYTNNVWTYDFIVHLIRFMVKNTRTDSSRSPTNGLVVHLRLSGGLVVRRR